MKKENMLFYTIIMLSSIMMFVISCRKGEKNSDEEKLALKEQELIAEVSKMLPDQMVSAFQTHLNAARNDEDYSDYLDSLELSVENLNHAIEMNFSLNEFKESFNTTLSHFNNLKSTGTINECFGLGYAKGVEIEIGTSGSVGAGIVAGLEADGGGGVRTVYDFVNLDRQVYYNSFCSHGYTFGAGATAALSGSIGFTGINELLLGIRYYGNTWGANKFEGASLATSHTLNASIATLFDIDFSIGIGMSKKAIADFSGFNNLLPCPENMIVIENEVSGYSFQVAGSIGAGVAAELVLAYGNNSIGSNSIGALNTFNKYSNNRPLAGFLMAGEILDESTLPGIVSIISGFDLVASAVAIIYGFTDFTACPEELPAIGTILTSSITNTSAVSGGIITNNGGSSIEASGVVWSIIESPSIINNSGITNEGTGTGEFTSYIADLNPNTTYYVRAYATNSIGTAYGQQRTFTTTGTGSAPVAAFTGSPTSGTTPLTVNFTDQSNNNPTSWQWNFGDGGNSTQQNPSHTYQNAGSYTVQLIATNSQGSDTEIKNNYITVTSGGGSDAPVAAFSGNPTNGTAPLTVSFTDQSTNNPTSWQWNFGDGGNSTQQNPSHTYNSAGTYTVELLVSNGYGSDTEIESSYIIVTNGGSSGEPCPGIPTVTDIDGNVYNTVLIGDQCWMKENLKTTKYRNGILIENASGISEWQNNLIGAYVWYDNSVSWKDIYGALYNFYATSNSNELCPQGWHVPDDVEWCALAKNIDPTVDCDVAWWSGTDAGQKMKATISWYSGGNGNNESEFTALAGGLRNTLGNFNSVSTHTYFWSSSETVSGAWSWALAYNQSGIHRYSNLKAHGYSVRCVKD
ncbi:MAG: PKD domain-containing protein [Bacteroidales bacterium]|nr:PKD domain-containing protein [Bacteroidales bacterium]